MLRAGTVLLAIALSFGLLPAASLPAQEPRGPPGGNGREFRLEQNYPNPVDTETWIPFHLEDSLFDGGEPCVVTIRIFNYLRQTVAVPRAVAHPNGEVPVMELTYTAGGRQLAYWDGRDSRGRRMPSGVYYYQLVVNDQVPQIRKLIVLNPRRRPSIIPWFGTRRDRPN